MMHLRSSSTKFSICPGSKRIAVVKRKFVAAALSEQHHTRQRFGNAIAFPAAEEVDHYTSGLAIHHHYQSACILFSDHRIRLQVHPAVSIAQQLPRDPQC